MLRHAPGDVEPWYGCVGEDDDAGTVADEITPAGGVIGSEQIHALCLRQDLPTVPCPRVDPGDQHDVRALCEQQSVDLGIPFGAGSVLLPKFVST